MECRPNWDQNLIKELVFSHLLHLSSSYFIFLLQRIIKRLHQFDLERNNTRILSTNRSITSVLLRLLIAGLIGYLLFTVVTPAFLNELDSQISIQLIPLISVFLMGLWIIFSFYIPQFGLKIIQSIFSLRILNNPKRKITWVNLFRRRTQFIGLLALITLTVSLFTFSVVYEETIRDNNTKNKTQYKKKPEIPRVYIINREFITICYRGNVDYIYGGDYREKSKYS